MTVCPNCGREVPGAPFCVCCGEPLKNASSPYPPEGRGFAAAPNELPGKPSIVSSLFPHLPRADMRVFRVALALGTALIVVLALLNAFPLALVVAAVLVPALTVLYFIDVNLYEDEPRLMLTLTIGWGALAGAGVGLVSRAVVRHDRALVVEADGDALLWLGVALPLASVALMMLGPLILLPYRKFNDVLDGATFGASCAVMFVGAQILTNSFDVLRSGLTVSGSTVPWLLRLLTLGIAKPVLVAATIGLAVSTLWLHYRAPIRARRSLGLMGVPLFAVPTAALAIVGISLAEAYLNRWLTAFVTLGAAALALVGLRRVIHFGLVEEHSPRDIGRPLVCPNCGRETPRHTFCAACGVALQALPKRRDGNPSPLGSGRGG